jgi:hypothetical protein
MVTKITRIFLGIFGDFLRCHYPISYQQKKSLNPFPQKNYIFFQSQNIFYSLSCDDKDLPSKLKNSVSKDVFGFPILDIFFVHFENSKKLSQNYFD